MILTISYRNGERRVIHLHPEFFTSTPTTVFNKKSLKVEQKVMTPSDKALELADILGTQPYNILLDRNGSIQMNKTINANEPIKPVKFVKVDEKQIKKDLRKECRHQPLVTYLHATF